MVHGGLEGDVEFFNLKCSMIQENKWVKRERQRQRQRQRERVSEIAKKNCSNTV